MWKNIGFKENPYDTKPLKVLKSDVDLLMGRESEQINFLTAIEVDSQGVFILSGVPGVGKTSFFNIQQYLLESGDALFGPQILAARTLCPIQTSDEPKNIVLRCIQSYCKSIEEYCISNKIKIPDQCIKVQAWVYQNKPATLNLGFSVMGNGLNFGREVHLPSVSDTTFETFVEIIGNLSIAVKEQIGFTGSFIVLDNIENLHVEDLHDCLTTFRDTLFTVPNIWWIIIGQSGLSSLIQSTNPKVFQRLSGSIELKPITIENLIKAVNIRVERFHLTETNGKSPITEETYLKLFESSNGEIRFVFKYCQEICVHLVQVVRKLLIAEKINIDDKSFQKFMGKFLVQKQIDNKFANDCLKEIITDEFNGLYLTQQEKRVLKKIGLLKKVKPKDFAEFKEFGIDTMQRFTNNFLTKLHSQQLLFRRQEGTAVTYELRGISVFAQEFELLD
ncbi:MAG: hypothetical protein A2046_16380 [Bacteroidetes bacterium GWA2_30_7]|nr:MAG: hypothetical protein A2046_16380 [Bacteroidetes bacterium GWA2_30_7]